MLHKIFSSAILSRIKLIVKAVVNDLFSTDKSIDGKSTLELHQEDTDEVNQFIQHSRNIHKFSKQQLLLIAIAWV